MIVFSKLRYKNILSTGNVFTEIELNRDPTTLISGTNGAGKSTFLDAITYVLYGKPFRKINKPQLINTINNREMLVEVEFAIGSHEYLIRRGMKPNVFEIFKNGELLNQDAATRDYQAYLEETILKINFKAFNQIVVLGSATYVPFMELPAGQRREVIEDLLDIQVFSTMNLLLKDRINTNKDDLSRKKYAIDLIKSKIESAEKHNADIRRIRETEVGKIQGRVTTILDEIEEEKATISGLQIEIEELLSSIDDKSSINKRWEKMRGLKADLNARRKTLASTLNFYVNHDECPTCKQGIDHKQDAIEENQQAITETDEALAQLSEKMAEVEERQAAIQKIELELQSKNNLIGTSRASIKLKMNTLKQFKKDLEAAEKEMEEVDRSAIDELNRDLATNNQAYEELISIREILGMVGSMLKDGGIKTRIIRQYVPVMNKLINKYLAAFDLFVDFQLDENFNEVIKSRFRDTFSYASFSEGEKLRINLAILLTWRAVSKMRNSISTNLLIMDEVIDGAADAAGVDSLIDTLHNLSSNDNVYVISHRGDQFGDKFTNHLKFQKVKNFSELAA